MPKRRAPEYEAPELIGGDAYAALTDAGYVVRWRVTLEKLSDLPEYIVVQAEIRKAVTEITQILGDATYLKLLSNSLVVVPFGWWMVLKDGQHALESHQRRNPH